MPTLGLGIVVKSRWGRYKLWTKIFNEISQLLSKMQAHSRYISVFTRDFDVYGQGLIYYKV